jgi:hypothetical protein
VFAETRVRHDPAAMPWRAVRHELFTCGCDRGDCKGDCARTGVAMLAVRTVAGRGAVTMRALTARTGRPVAATTCATGGPNEPPRTGAARGAGSGEVRWMITGVRCTATTCTEIGCVKCWAGTATQAGWEYP